MARYGHQSIPEAVNKSSWSIAYLFGDGTNRAPIPNGVISIQSITHQVGMITYRNSLTELSSKKYSRRKIIVNIPPTIDQSNLRRPPDTAFENDKSKIPNKSSSEPADIRLQRISLEVQIRSCP